MRSRRNRARLVSKIYRAIELGATGRRRRKPSNKSRH